VGYVLRCPGCQTAFGFKPSLAGKRKQCPKCGTLFLVPDAVPSSVEDFEETETEPPEEPDAVAEDAFEGVEEPSAPPAWSGAADLTGGAANRPPPPARPPMVVRPAATFVRREGRYPNLVRYIGMIKANARIILTISVCVAGLVVLGGFAALMRDDLLGIGVSVFITALLSAGAIVAMGYSMYVLLMALAEFIQVAMDIEANTRTAAKPSRSITDSDDALASP
jgi:hypothetical protein